MVYFIGAGPGDPKLLTIKGKEIIDKADIIIYAGSLVNKEVLATAKKEALIYNSAYMNLDEVIDVMLTNRDKLIARVHTGDPSIYGAIREQMDRLRELHIEFDIIPGVSSFLAAAASLEAEYTLPNVSQSIILTRMEGRTPVPPMESIEEFAKHQTTMVIFLSVGEIETLVSKLATSYPQNTPMAVVYKASWEEEKIVRGNLADIVKKVKDAGITKTALTIIGNFLGDSYELSKLYDKHFTTEFRKGMD